MFILRGRYNEWTQLSTDSVAHLGSRKGQTGGWGVREDEGGGGDGEGGQA